MAIIVPIVTSWDPGGLKKAFSEIDRAKGPLAKTGKAFEAGLVPAAGALVGIGAAAKSWVTEAEGGRAASAALSQVFKQMGDSTGQAAQAAEDYASKMSAQIGVDDDVIKQTQTKLATFSALSSEVGRSSGMFDRATAAAHDLAAAGFGDASSNAVQLGKALQDPSKGMAALAKSGITFTDAEKKKIKAMQKSGDLLGAQRIIMGAVETQVKGTAAASATSSDKIATSWGNVKESLGTALLPIVDKLAAKFGSMATWIGDNTTAVLALVGVLGTFAGIVVAVNAAMKVYQTYQAISEIMTKRQAAAQRMLNLSMLANPVFLIIAAIVALVVAFVLLWRKSEAFRNFFKGLWDGIKGAVSAVLDWFKTAVPAAWDAVKAAFVAAWNGIKAALVAVWDGIKAAAVAVWDGLKAAVMAVWDGLKAAAAAVWNGIKAVITGVWTVVTTVIRTYVNTIKAIVLGVWNAIKTVTSNTWNGIKLVITAVWSAIKTVITTYINAVKTVITGVWNIIKGVLKGNPVAPAIAFFRDLRDKITGFMQTIKDKVGAAWDWVRAKIDAIKSKMSSVPFVGNLFKSLADADGATISFLPGAEQVPTRRERAVTINVSGAVDQEGTARTLSAMLDNLDVRHSRPVARAVAW